MAADLPWLIGLYSSRPQSGKSTVANFLREWMDYRIVKFAGPLKAMTRGLLDALGYDPKTVERMIEGDLKEDRIFGLPGVTPRKIMQTLGTEWGRAAVAANLWVDMAMDAYRYNAARGNRTVIDDLRFPNEAEAILNAGGTLIKIVRPQAAEGTQHVSEGALEEFNFHRVIVNDGDVGHLHREVMKAL